MWRRSTCVTVSNFVAIGQSVADIWRFYRSVAAAILDFENLNSLTVERVKRVIRHDAKFRDDRSSGFWDMAIFRFFQDGGPPPSSICNYCWKTSQFKTVCKDDSGCITQLKQQKSKRWWYCLAAHRHIVNLLTSNITFLILELWVLTSPIGYHWQCVCSHCACGVSCDLCVGGEFFPHIWNPWPRFAYSFTIQVLWRYD